MPHPLNTLTLAYSRSTSYGFHIMTSRLIRLTRAGVVGSLVILVVALVCVRLGIWQLHRLEQRRARNAATVARMRETPIILSSFLMDSTGILFRRTRITGEYDDEHTIVAAGRSFHGLPGVYILTPLRVGGAAVLVNRGWMPSADAANIDLQGIREPAPRNLEALIVEFSRDPRPPDRDTAASFKRVWFHLNHAAVQRSFPYPLASYVVQILPSQNAPKFPKRVDAPELDEGPHLGYVIQWFSFAIIAVAGWLIILLRTGAVRTKPKVMS